jgi:uncharacterized protein (TIGR00369 family)
VSFLVKIPFVDLLGMEFLGLGVGEARIAIDLRDEHTNSWGVAHGGLLMTLLDVALAHAARSPQREGGELQPGVVTIEMKTSFMRPGQGRLVAHGRRLHRSATLAFCDGSVLNAAGELVGHATGTFKYTSGLPVGDGRRVQRLNASD